MFHINFLSAYFGLGMSFLSIARQIETIPIE